MGKDNNILNAVLVLGIETEQALKDKKSNVLIIISLINIIMLLFLLNPSGIAIFIKITMLTSLNANFNYFLFSIIL